MTYCGTDLIGATPRDLARICGDRISMIFQDPMTSLNPSMKIGTQIREVLHQHKAQLRRAETRARTIELPRRGLSAFPSRKRGIGQYPHQFSGGMRQRIMIAIAISMNPDILIADEPTTALDVTIQSQIFRLIREVQRMFGTAMILITHDLGLVAGVADRVLVMYGGRVVEEGKRDQIYYKPQHPYTFGLLNAVPKLTDARDQPLRTIEGLPPLLIDPPNAGFLRRPLPVCHEDLPAAGPRLFCPSPRQSRCLLAASRRGRSAA